MAPHLSLFYFLLLFSSLAPSLGDCSGYQPPVPITSSNYWTSSPLSSLRIRDHSAVVIEDRNGDEYIYIYGGLDSPTTDSSSVSSDTNVYAIKLTPPSTYKNVVKQITVMENLPHPRFGHSSFVWKSSMFILGGFTQVYENDLWRFDPEGFTVGGVNSNSTWRGVNTTGLTLDGHYGGTSNIVWQDASSASVITFGGISETGAVISDPHLLIVSDTTNKVSCKASVVGNYGSCTDYVQSRPDSTGVYSAIPLHASSATTPPSGRSHHAAVVPKDSNCLYIFGGRDSSTGTIFGDLWSLCPHNVPFGSQITSSTPFVWTEVSADYSNNGFLPVPRYSHGLVESAPNRLFLSSGSGSWPNQYMLEEAEYDIGLNLWVPVELGDNVTPRRGSSFTKAASAIVSIGGASVYETLNTLHTTNFTSSLCSSGYALILCRQTLKIVCKPCVEGQFSLQGSYNCTACASGSYQPASHADSCVDCTAGKYGDGGNGASDASHCLLCEEGTASNMVGAPSSAACVDCTSGKFSLAGNTSCSTCPGGRFSPSQSNQCSPCLAGTYSSSGAGSCSDCSGGKFTSTDEATVCSNCFAGTYSNNADFKCRNCPKGRYSTADLGSTLSSCLDCPMGRYQNAVAQIFCHACSTGKANSLTRQKNVNSCIDCLDGYFAASTGTSSCSPCPPGEFGDGVGAQACSLCRLGTYSTATAAPDETTCQDCPAGRFTPILGTNSLSGCDSCPAGKYSLPTDGDGCFDCPRGRFTSTTEMAQKNNCTACNRNEYADQRGSNTCTDCPANTFSHYGYAECIKCSLTSSNSDETSSGPQLGVLQGFYASTDELPLWSLDDTFHTLQKATSSDANGRIVSGSTDTLNARGNISYVAEMDFYLSTPLVLRGFAKINNGASWDEVAMALSISLDTRDGPWEVVERVTFGVSSSSDWRFAWRDFAPRPNQIAKFAKVTLEFGGDTGDVDFADIGLFNSPFVGCDCENGYYMNLDTPACRVCENQPSCRLDAAECYRCPIGNSCASGTISKCGRGTHAWGGAVECEACPVGWICENGIALPCASTGLIEGVGGGSCEECPGGHECGAGVAKACLPGKYSRGGNEFKHGQQCLVCEPGRYSGTSAATECQDCPIGKTSSFMRDECENCPEGTETVFKGQYPCQSL